MTDGNQRHMIRLDKQPQLFSFRVAGLLIRNGHVLVQRGLGDNYWALPGGRAEIGETSEETLVREMREELHRDVSILRLLWTAENFFHYAGYQAHELAFYYLIDMQDDFPFHTDDIVHSVEDGAEVQFRWLEATSACFSHHDVRPHFIGKRIETLPERHEHLIVREGNLADGAGRKTKQG
jgi:ADP-ribose pyrophosphatase YjhB (NUDIX family)